eukprot:356346-Chlamydomonas_euryale.AAC.2
MIQGLGLALPAASALPNAGHLEAMGPWDESGHSCPDHTCEGHTKVKRRAAKDWSCWGPNALQPEKDRQGRAVGVPHSGHERESRAEAACAVETERPPQKFALCS